MSIVYGVCIGDEDKYQRFATPGLERIGATNRIIESRGNRSIFVAYNEMLDVVRRDATVEALVLLHEDLEIRDIAFEDKIRGALEDGLAVIGTIGGRGATGIRWVRASQQFGRQPDTNADNDYGGGSHDVDMVDGCLMVLSRWAIENLQFDESFSGFHGYDADICMQARTRGQRVGVIDVDTFHHTKGGFGNIAQHQRTDDRFCRKWNIPLAPWEYRRNRLFPRLAALGRRLRSSVDRLTRTRRVR